MAASEPVDAFPHDLLERLKRGSLTPTMEQLLATVRGRMVADIMTDHVMHSGKYVVNCEALDTAARYRLWHELDEMFKGQIREHPQLTKTRTFVNSAHYIVFW
jgi:hypothetical protein